MILYFSGVGNSAWVARKLAAMLNDRVVSIAEEIRMDREYALAPNEPIGFVFPVYGWEPPKIVMDFVRKMKMSAPTYLYFVCTCGDDTGKTADVFMSALSAKGWKCHASYSILMPDTYVCLPGFDIDGEDELKRKNDNAAARVKFIGEELSHRVVMDKHGCFEGAFPKVKTYVLGGLFRKFLMSPKPFHATDACVSCGFIISSSDYIHIKNYGKSGQ